MSFITITSSQNWTRAVVLPHYPNLSDADAKRGYGSCVFRILQPMFPDQFSVLVSYPIAPDKTREELHIFLIGDAATSDLYKHARDATLKMWMT